MQSSIALLSLFHVSGLKPAGIRLLESAAERDQAEWLAMGPPAAASPGLGPTGGASAANGSAAVAGPAAGAAAAGGGGAVSGAAGVASTSPAAGAGAAAPGSSLASNLASSSSHLTFGVVSGRLVPLGR